MTRQTNASKKQRRRFSEEFKAEALALADNAGVTEAADQLGLQTSQLYAWRSKAEMRRRQGEVDQKMATENARLKRLLAEKDQEVAILKKAAAYFARSLT